jgi:alpha-D-xyloside xylohydrolase
VDVEDQWMFGQDVLVAPLIAGVTKRKVIFPKGKWYDFYTGDEVMGSEIELQSNLGPIPLFVRDGALVPMLPEGGTSIENHFSHLEVRHYGNKDGIFELYDDDGVSFDFEKEEYSLFEIKRNQAQVGTVAQIRGKRKSELPTITWREMTKASTRE